jgi:hypothetical protein
MKRYGTMSEKVGLAGNIDVPLRQASTSSAMSDDAVPTSDPSDVSGGVRQGKTTQKLTMIL